MLTALIRIIPVQFKLHQLAKYCAWLFVAFAIALLGQKIPRCVTTAPEWTVLANPQCHLGMDVGILELCSQFFLFVFLLFGIGFATNIFIMNTADFVGDSILIAIPLHLLWGLSVSRARYRLLMAIFCASVFTTVVSIVHGWVPQNSTSALGAHIFNFRLR